MARRKQVARRVKTLPAPMPERPPKPTMHLSGKHAEKITKRYRIGQRIKALVSGKVMEVGQSTYTPPGQKPTHHATIQMDSVRC